jgi:phage terminase large subunit-like protein
MQLAPQGAWNGWLIIAGRGWGKTRVGAEFVRTQVEAEFVKRVAFVSETSADGRNVMVEGETGILAISHPQCRPLYEPSKRRLTWPNGAIATLYDAREPDQLRGPQHDLVWFDELAKYRYAEAVFDQAMFGLRIGAQPRWIATTTPRPIALIRRLINQTGVVVTRGRSEENLGNLAASFRDNVIARYRGTRLGRQELDAEILEDVPGALWTRRVIDETRVNLAPELQRIVVGVDPAATSGENANETGIVVMGLAGTGHAYVLEDWSLRASPDGWARKAAAAWRKWSADCLVAEANQGGEMVERVIRSVADIPVKLVRATRGKYVRAEPISALYEQGRVHHVGVFPELEDQMVAFTPSELSADGSPDRMDALVWAATELFPEIVAPAVARVSARQHHPGGWMF